MPNLIATVAITLTLSGGSLAVSPLQANAFYPLAVGNSWKYCPNGVKDGADCVTWTVQHMQAGDKDPVFSVLSSPGRDDDDIMTLSPNDKKVTELEVNHDIIVITNKIGYSWSYRELDIKTKKYYIDVFKIIKIGKCMVGKFKFDNCISVQGSDPAIGIMQIATYARTIGPVSYKYYHMGDKKPFSVLNVVNWKVKGE